MTAPEDRLQPLRARFLERSAGDLYALKSERDPTALRFIVHRLAGAAGTFGFPDLSRLAGEIDDRLVLGEVIGDADLEPLIAELERLLQAAPR